MAWVSQGLYVVIFVEEERRKLSYVSVEPGRPGYTSLSAASRLPKRFSVAAILLVGHRNEEHSKPTWRNF